MTEPDDFSFPEELQAEDDPLGTVRGAIVGSPISLALWGLIAFAAWQVFR